LRDKSLEFLDRTAVMSFCLSVITQEQGPTIGLANRAVETFRQSEIAVLCAGDFRIAGGDQRFTQGNEWNIAVHGLVHAGGEESRLEAGGAEEGVLGERHSFEGEEFLGVGGLVERNEVGGEMGDPIQIFEPDDRKMGAGEAVQTGVLGGAGLAFGGAGSGGEGGVGAVGGELFFGDG